MNTRGQGLAASEGLRFALICLIAAIAVLVIFYFLNTGTKMRAVAAPDMPSSSSMGVPAPAAT
ncbi:MAG: hypothetical protein IAI50_16310 [Candidatus Eremiobacteraeota bacterium]|nr:hypothetical protein [Candidatus Eremiobacteraeota bacterium]